MTATWEKKSLFGNLSIAFFFLPLISSFSFLEVFSDVTAEESVQISVDMFNCVFNSTINTFKSILDEAKIEQN